MSTEYLKKLTILFWNLYRNILFLKIWNTKSFSIKEIILPKFKTYYKIPTNQAVCYWNRMFINRSKYINFLTKPLK